MKATVTPIPVAGRRVPPPPAYTQFTFIAQMDRESVRFHNCQTQ
jgi:hypothetical protein